MPNEYKIPKEEMRGLSREYLSTAMRPLRRGLGEALTQSRLAPTAPLRRYHMRGALEGFSSGIGGAVQKAREYGRGVAGEKARFDWEAREREKLRKWKTEEAIAGRAEAATAREAGFGEAATARDWQTELWKMKRGWEEEDQPPRIKPGVYPHGGPYEYYAKGGPVSRKKPYMVGEEGPELFVPEQRGRIIPNPRTQMMMKSNSLYIPRQTGGEVDPLTPPLEEQISPVSRGFIGKGGMRTPAGARPALGTGLGTPTGAIPSTPLPRRSMPTGGIPPKRPGHTKWYEDLLKKRRLQTPLRSLI